MFKHSLLRLAMLMGSIAPFLLSCSKTTDPNPDHAFMPDAQGVKVLSNGRLVFKDDKAFDQVFEKVWSMTPDQLNSWEGQLGITSLRKSNYSGDTASANLMRGFGFCSQYATLISKAGEYQIADRISWFHKGFRYVAHSEAELQRVKANPAMTTEKYVAGLQPMPDVSSQARGASGNSASLVRNLSSDQQYGDGKYGKFEFLLFGDPGSRRRLNFESIMYVEDQQDRGIVGGKRPWFTSISINEYFEYYSNGRKTWLRADDGPRISGCDVTANGFVRGADFWPPATNGVEFFGPKGDPAYTYNRVVFSNVSHRGGDFRTGILATRVFSDLRPARLGPFYWTFEITGGYSTYLEMDPVVSFHSESGTLW